MRTTLGRFGRRSRLLSWIVSSPSPAASRKALRAVVTQTPARAAISPIVIMQAPRSRTASATIRSAASSPVVNRAASCGGMGPDAASVRRRAIEACRSGDLGARRFLGKWLARPAAKACATICGAR
ncbi:MAG TPA: hypothetical protein VK446_16840, partial [Methylocystis sp.]|nr:hypothetical protein [Methylocystis sp.]